MKDCMSLHTLHSTLHTPYSTLYTFHSTLHTLHFTLDTPDSTLYTLHFTLYTLHFTLYTLRSTLYTLHCPPPSVMILSPLVHRLLEAQTICSTLGIVILALQPFATHSLLIPLQTLLFRNPNGRRSPLSFGVPPFSSVFPFPRAFNDFPSFSEVFSSLFPAVQRLYLHFPSFSSVFHDFPSFSLVFSCLSTDLGGIEAYRHLFA